MQSVWFQGNSGNDSVVYYRQVYTASDFCRAEYEFSLQNVLKVGLNQLKKLNSHLPFWQKLDKARLA